VGWGRDHRDAAGDHSADADVVGRILNWLAALPPIVEIAHLPNVR
jgi:hypothetical protein